MERKVKEFYEKPTVVKHSLGLMNKFGWFSSSIPHTAIDGVSVRGLVEQYGSPLWVVSEATLRRKYRELYRAFTLRYPRVAVAYSYKTNYLSGVCAILHQEGAWAEVVSGFEYSIAEALGIPGPQIVFNGPHKTEEQLLTAIERGSRINVDSYEEISLLEEIAKGRDKPVGIGVRVNMAVGYPAWDRFGFHLESGQALYACQRIMSSPVLRLVGLHVHLGTFITDVNLY
ncbi:MAG: alanine racemase, partial [Chloroflexota bacterium]|nr:alanine racemase [Chloroflexota bacterium]